jgi:hypothetical protein
VAHAQQFPDEEKAMQVYTALPRIRFKPPRDNSRVVGHSEVIPSRAAWPCRRACRRGERKGLGFRTPLNPRHCLVEPLCHVITSEAPSTEI